MPREKENVKKSTPVGSFVHAEEQRTNIPTAELETFMKDVDRASKKVTYPRPSALLYPRDPAGDPQLVWRGKDERDLRPFEVVAPPIYIQEKIHPKALIEDLRRQKTGTAPAQADLFGDFNGIAFDDLVDFYQHEQHWSNRMILGDSLEVMTSLAEREGLKGQVQTVYMDPPYGIDFRSNWQVSTRNRDVKDGKANDATRQPEQVRAFRDTWALGIHSYLTYLRDRLALACQLLSPLGSVFVQIGDENVHLVRSLLDELLGADHFVAQINFKSTSALGQQGLRQAYDYIVWYAPDPARMKFRPLFKDRDIRTEREWRYLDDPTAPSGFRKIHEDEFLGLKDWTNIFRRAKLTSSGFTPSCTYEFELDGRICRPFGGKSWLTTPAGMERLRWAGRLFMLGDNPYSKQYYRDFPAINYENSWSDQPAAEERLFVVQTAPKFIQRCVLMTSDPGDLVLDPTCGSGTTAYVAEHFGRRWITVDTSRVALALARQRLMTAKYPMFRLRDALQKDLRQGFIYRTISHVTLKSVANNPEIVNGITPAEANAAVARHADQEVLYDDPEVVRGVVRVTGPFTVESLSPLLGEDAGGPISGAALQTIADADDFQAVIIDNLRAAGVQNSVRNERLTFARLEPWPGKHINAVGDYSEDGALRRAAITIGPQYGTVDADLVRDAAKEAAGFFNILVICGFAFDSYITNEFKQLGNLTILKANMNPDLSMGGDLLKKTGTGNLFTVFGEPDIEVRDRNGQFEVEIKGIDVYDPTTGQIHSHSTGDIACWSIDTAYDGNSFFVRHAYFTGEGDPYKSLRAALKIDIDDAAWESLYSKVSRPFDAPATGRIAVKVISHYGDEVMKVYEIAETKMLVLPQARYGGRIAPAELLVADAEPDQV